MLSQGRDKSRVCLQEEREREKRNIISGSKCGKTYTIWNIYYEIFYNASYDVSQRLWRVENNRWSHVRPTDLFIETTLVFILNTGPPTQKRTIHGHYDYSYLPVVCQARSTQFQLREGQRECERERGEKRNTEDEETQPGWLTLGIRDWNCVWETA